MIDISFWEIAVIGVVALVVLGPERLPKVARTAGHLFGRLQRYVATVKADLNREMEMSELAKVKQEVQEAARAFEQGAQEHANLVNAEANKVSQALESPAATAPAGNATTAPSPAVSVSQTSMLAEQDAAFSSLSEPAPGATDETGAPMKMHEPPVRAPSAPQAQTFPSQTSFDFGIEPVRRKAS
jgi:sec-independent protein translocase protein TatB